MVVVGAAAAYEEFEATRREAAKARFFAIVDEIHAANAGVDPEEVEKDVAEALARVRAQR